jgi:DNA polymerase-1
VPQSLGPRLVVDIESDGLLVAENDKPAATKVHCFCTLNIDTGEKRRFRSSVKPGSGESIEDGLAYLASASLLINHNILSFDLRLLAKLYGWQFTGEVFDTLVASNLIWTNLWEIDSVQRRIPPALWGLHKLEAWGQRLKVLKGDFGKTTDWKEWSQEMEDYCAQDVEVTAELFRRIEAKKYSPEALKLEHDFKRIIILQESHGFRFDEEGAHKLIAQLQSARVKLTETLQGVFPPRVEVMKTPAYYYFEADPDTHFLTKKAAVSDDVSREKMRKGKLLPGPLREKHHPFNPGSRDQIATRLTERYGWKPKKFTDTGKPAIDEGVLAAMPWPEARLLGDFLVIEKTLGQLAEGKGSVLSKVRNGRVHGGVNTNGAVTGRCTHMGPNIAQTPKVMVGKNAEGKKVVMLGLDGGFGWEFRSLYCADLGWELTGWDASSLELRCLAHFLARYDGGAFEKVLLEGDVHTENQKNAGFYLRDSAKTFIYAYLYGAGDAKLGSIAVQDCIDAGKPKPKGTRKSIGAGLRARFEKNFSALKRLKDAIKAAVPRGYLIGLDGRRLHIRSEHAALNTLLQSAGALLMKKALVFQHQFLTEQGLVFARDYAFVANIHDEVQTTHRPGLAELIGKSGPAALKKAGEFFGFRCRLDGEFKTGKTWADTH